MSTSIDLLWVPVCGVSVDMTHRYSSLEDAAAYFGVGPQTIRNWGSEGRIKLYRLPGGRTLRVRIDEIEAALRVVPTVKRTA
jgi:excisionase family DNA binding protein